MSLLLAFQVGAVPRGSDEPDEWDDDDVPWWASHISDVPEAFAVAGLYDTDDESEDEEIWPQWQVFTEILSTTPLRPSGGGLFYPTRSEKQYINDDDDLLVIVAHLTRILQ